MNLRKIPMMEFQILKKKMNRIRIKITLMEIKHRIIQIILMDMK